MASYVKFNSWTLHARRFVRPPVFTWEPVAGAVKYRIGIASHGPARYLREAVWYEVSEPRFDFAATWNQLPFGTISMLVLPFSREGREVCATNYPDNQRRHHFVKSPGWRGGVHVPMDWEAPAKKAIAYLLAGYRDEVAPFEEGLPRHLWSATEQSYSGIRHYRGEVGRIDSYPSLHFPWYISAFLTYSTSYANDPLAEGARKTAVFYLDWLLNNHHPFDKDYACGGFPFSYIKGGKLEEQSPLGVNSVTLFRAAPVAEVMLYAAESLAEPAYEDYARQVADGLLKFQRADGSWPFRVNPKTGEIIAEYTSAVILPARLMRILYEKTGQTKYKQSHDKAIEWMFANPMQTNRWEGMFEDVEAKEPHVNLQNYDVNEVIRYLVYFRDEIDDAIAHAVRLNDFIEDQFVMWDTGDEALLHGHVSPAPMVWEQYVCWCVMPGHTAKWILSLISLHSATGRREYLDKAIAAANAICRSQTPSGAMATWGFDLRFDRPTDPEIWYGCSALSAKALILLRTYLSAVESGQAPALGLNESAAALS